MATSESFRPPFLHFTWHLSLSGAASFLANVKWFTRALAPRSLRGHCVCLPSLPISSHCSHTNHLSSFFLTKCSTPRCTSGPLHSCSSCRYIASVSHGLLSLCLTVDLVSKPFGWEYLGVAPAGWNKDFQLAITMSEWSSQVGSS